MDQTKLILIEELLPGSHVTLAIFERVEPSNSILVSFQRLFPVDLPDVEKKFFAFLGTHAIPERVLPFALIQELIVREVSEEPLHVLHFQEQALQVVGHGLPLLRADDRQF